MNMISSSEAFSQFSTWKNSKRRLDVTVIVSGKTVDRLPNVRVYEVDESASVVGLVGSTPHSFKDFDVVDSIFSSDSSRMIVMRKDSDWLVFEELA
ncbi:hypothetical protein [Silvibacterium sp.]|uniref:hypothetical protein n=1 Tax=Silvibacterium sp. TaxID=1964179 RepID=UPI0039E6E7A1